MQNLRIPLYCCVGQPTLVRAMATLVPWPKRLEALIAARLKVGGAFLLNSFRLSALSSGLFFSLSVLIR